MLQTRAGWQEGTSDSGAGLTFQRFARALLTSSIISQVASISVLDVTFVKAIPCGVGCFSNGVPGRACRDGRRCSTASPELHSPIFPFSFASFACFVVQLLFLGSRLPRGYPLCPLIRWENSPGPTDPNSNPPASPIAGYSQSDIGPGDSLSNSPVASRWPSSASSRSLSRGSLPSSGTTFEL